MEEYRQVKKPTRQDFEDAARRYFYGLSRELDRPRGFDPDRLDQEVAEQCEHSQGRINELTEQLVRNEFDPTVIHAARILVASLGLDLDQLTDARSEAAKKLAARAQREFHARYIADLSGLAGQPPSDTLFSSPTLPIGSTAMPSSTHEQPGKFTLDYAVADYLREMQRTGIGASHHDETKRLLGWLKEAMGAARPIDEIAKLELRDFRNGISRMDRTARGQKRPFKDRQTLTVENQLKGATATKYWQATQAFFGWAMSNGLREDDPSLGMDMLRRKDEEPASPSPFTQAELERFFDSPLYSGNQSPSRPSAPGPNRLRLHDWWFGILALHTGMRAGELSQLEPENFFFDGEVPYLTVSKSYADGRKKNVKNGYSVRDVPLHPSLVTLGIRQFVEQAKGKSPDGRLFLYRVGGAGKSSEGASQFWGRYLRKTGLWSEGRATHVFRHTIVDNLRANGAIDEDIAALEGHAPKTMTGKYGGAQPLSRKLETLKRLDYGIDVVAAVGGPYDKKRHSP